MPGRSPWEEKLKGLRKAGPEQSYQQHQHAHKQFVFKVTSHIKTKGGVKAVADYISSNGGSVEHKAFDENGHELNDEEIHQEIEDWNLLTNSENLSKKARDLPAAERQNLDYKDRYRHVQANHMILSFPMQHYEVSDRQLHNVAQEFLQPLAEHGHRALYVIHRHQKNPHIHVLVRSQGNYGRLRLAKSQLQTLRRWGASVSRDNGLDTYAHNRENRRDVVKAIEDGKVPLRKPSKTWRRNQKQKSQKTGRSLLERQAPTWYARNGLAYEAKRNGSKQHQATPRKLDLPPLPEHTAKVIDQHFEKSHTAPSQARQSFLEMLAENRKTAMWYVNHRPEVFGQAKADRPNQRLTDQHLKLPDQWRIDAQKRIDADLLAQNPLELSKVQTLTEMYRRHTSDKRTARQRQYDRSRLEQIHKGKPQPSPASEQPKATPPKRSNKGFVEAVKSLFKKDAPEPVKTVEPAPQRPTTKADMPPRSDPSTQARAEQIYKSLKPGLGPDRSQKKPSRTRTRGRER